MGMKQMVFMMVFDVADLADFNGVFSTFDRAENTLKRMAQEQGWRDFGRVDISDWTVDETSEHGWACYEFVWEDLHENVKVGVIIERTYIDVDWEG